MATRKMVVMLVTMVATRKLVSTSFEDNGSTKCVALYRLLSPERCISEILKAHVGHPPPRSDEDGARRANGLSSTNTVVWYVS